MKPRIMLVEDEADLGNVVKQYLEVMDFEVDWCYNGKMASEKFQRAPELYQIVLIDINLPEMDGFELAHALIQADENASFLFLTARSDKSDRLKGLKIGADDYITKPFDVDELVLRIRNIIKRKSHTHSNGNNGQPCNCLEAGPVKFNRDSLKLTIGNKKEITLTPREAELLEYLFNHPNRVIKREDLLVQLWGKNDYFLGRSLDVFISRLRKHLGNDEQVSITNIYGVGFVFNLKEA